MKIHIVPVNYVRTFQCKPGFQIDPVTRTLEWLAPLAGKAFKSKIGEPHGQPISVRFRYFVRVHKRLYVKLSFERFKSNFYRLPPAHQTGSEYTYCPSPKASLMATLANTSSAP